MCERKKGVEAERERERQSVSFLEIHNDDIHDLLDQVLRARV